MGSLDNNLFTFELFVQLRPSPFFCLYIGSKCEKGEDTENNSAHVSFNFLNELKKAIKW